MAELSHGVLYGAALINGVALRLWTESYPQQTAEWKNKVTSSQYSVISFSKNCSCEQEDAQSESLSRMI